MSSQTATLSIQSAPVAAVKIVTSKADADKQYDTREFGRLVRLIGQLSADWRKADQTAKDSDQEWQDLNAKRPTMVANVRQLRAALKAVEATEPKTNLKKDGGQFAVLVDVPKKEKLAYAATRKAYFDDLRKAKANLASAEKKLRETDLRMDDLDSAWKAAKQARFQAGKEREEAREELADLKEDQPGVEEAFKAWRTTRRAPRKRSGGSPDDPEEPSATEDRTPMPPADITNLDQFPHLK